MHYTTKAMLMDAARNLPRTIYNLVSTAQLNPYEFQTSLIRNLVLSMPQSEQEKYARECQYVRSMRLDNVNEISLPYAVRTDAKKVLEDVHVKTGHENGLPYVLHAGSKKVFYPADTGESALVESYKGLVYAEGITGAGALEESPHCYEDAEFFLENGECLLDVGSAEALFAVEKIDKVKKAFLFECERCWQKPLKRTFLPYGEKVKIIGKMVSDSTSKHTTRIVDAIGKDISADDRFFVKMDIEGGERFVIKGNEDFFRNNKVKLSCCVYHRQDDAIVIKDTLERLGYTTRFSKGYMLIGMNGIHYPYFRHGVIYAKNY